MATNSRLGPGGLTGLASSLRSAAHGAALTSPAQGHPGHNNNNNNGSHLGSHHRQHPYDADSRVPDEDDSTEEDEEYRSYVQEQDQGHSARPGQYDYHQNNNNNNPNSLRQLLRDDENEGILDSNNEHPAKSTMDIVDTNLQSDNNLLVQARQNQILDDSEESFDEDEEDDLDEDGSETLSLTEDDIDFSLVYAFHTFVATQEGQASVVRNDSLMLLEDVNVYWWLVRVLKTGVIGYIPAENIEVGAYIQKGERKGQNYSAQTYWHRTMVPRTRT
jgi:hypothetical protein